MNRRKSQMRRSIHGYVLFYFIGSRPLWCPWHLLVDLACYVRARWKKTERNGRREKGPSRPLLRSRERETGLSAESAMWTQSRSSDQLIDCLYGGCYLGVSTWAGWQTFCRRRHHERMNSTWDLPNENANQAIRSSFNPFLSHYLWLAAIMTTVILWVAKEAPSLGEILFSLWFLTGLLFRGKYYILYICIMFTIIKTLTYHTIWQTLGTYSDTLFVQIQKFEQNWIMKIIYRKLGEYWQVSVINILLYLL